MSALDEALALLENVTPLKTDCGRLCGAACCEPLAGEETGMLLFPGEEERYTGLPGYRMKKAGKHTIVVCSGRCDRALRPLSCRIFPLLPLYEDGAVRIVRDQRARAVCPLFREGVNGLDPAFVQAVRKAGELIAGTEEGAAFLSDLAAEQAQLKALRKAFSGR